jgi:hypothetical protein
MSTRVTISSLLAERVALTAAIAATASEAERIAQRVQLAALDGLIAATVKEEGALAGGAPRTPLDVLTLFTKDRRDKLTRDACPAVKNALKNDDAAMLEWFIRAGRADIHAFDSECYTLLQAAAYHGSVRCIAMLLKLSPVKDACNRQGVTALHFAAVAGHAGAVSALLDGGLTLEATTFDGVSAATVMTKCGNLTKDVVRVFQQRGADMSGFYEAALSDGSNGDRCRLAEEMLAEMTPAARTALAFATVRGKKRLLRKLVELGIDVNAVDASGKSLFVAAAELPIDLSKESLPILLKTSGIKPAPDDVVAHYFGHVKPGINTWAELVGVFTDAPSPSDERAYSALV